MFNIEDFMKKLLLLIIFCVLPFFAANAKKLTLTENNFEKGDFCIGPYAGVYHYLGYGLGVDAELAITDIIGIGNISVGADLSVGFQNDSWAYYGYYSSSISYTDVNFYGYAAYHFKIIKNKMFDPYAKLGLGFSATSHSSVDPRYDKYYSYRSSLGVITVGEVGMRFFFSDNFAVRAFVGYPWLGVGADFKF